MKKFILLFYILSILNAQAAHDFKENYYQEKWCSQWNGILEYRLNDDTRVDCLTKNYAVEFDFAPKWAESIGQSLYYSLETGKKPAVVLILESDSDIKYLKRAQKLANKHDIQLWEMKKPENYEHEINFNFNNAIYKFVSGFIKQFIDEILKSIFA